MDASILQILRRADDLEHWECPIDFPRENEVARVIALQPLLEKVVGNKLILDRNVEDAAYFAELSWQADPRPEPGIGGQVILTYLAIRFSAFGQLVTLWGNVPEAPIPSSLEEQLCRILLNAGYKVIPAQVLDGPYDGQHKFKSQITTWWLRYFDYC